MGIRPTGVSAGGVGIQWEYMETQRDVANAVLLLLSDRRLLDPNRHTRPEIEAQYCYQSAQHCREELSQALKHAKPAKLLSAELQAIRGAFTTFIEAGGPNGRTFTLAGLGPASFECAQASLRHTVLASTARIAQEHHLKLPPQLTD